jgi:hypothetical protein
MAVRRRRVPRFAGLVVSFATLAAVAVGCASGIVSRGHIQPDRLEEVQVRTERARGISVQGEINARVVSRRDLDVIVRDAVLAQWQPDEIARYEDGLVAVGVWPVDRDVMTEYVAPLDKGATGLYVPWGRAIYLVSKPAIPLSLRWAKMEKDLAHELVHLLQHQAYPHLMGISPSFKEQDDAGYAVQTAVEGDAFRYGLEAVGVRLPDPEDFERSFKTAGKDDALTDAPTLIRLAVTHAYTDGYRLSYEEGTGLLDAPPASTEQILHPGKRREPFLVFDLSAARFSLPEGCRFVYENTVGELALSVLFSDWQDSAPRSAWEGWDGDRYLVSRCEGRLGLLWISSWDTEADAREFAEAYEPIAEPLAAAAGLDSAPRVTLRGRQVIVASERLSAQVAALFSARRQRVATLDELFEYLPAGSIEP